MLCGLSTAVFSRSAGCLGGILSSPPTTTLTEVRLWNYDETNSQRVVLIVERDDETVYEEEHTLAAASDEHVSTTTVTCPWEAVAGQYTVNAAVGGGERWAILDLAETAESLPDRVICDVTYRPDRDIQASASFTERDSELTTVCQTDTPPSTDDEA